MTRPSLTALLSVAAALELATGCARDVAGTAGFSSGSQSGTSAAGNTSTGGDTSSGASTSMSSSGSASASGSNSTSTSEDSSTAAASASTWDMDPPPDFDVPPVGCQGKIDFLFVISSYYEMKPFQDRLKAAFPTFVDLLRQELADFDYQIMVVDAAHDALMQELCSDCYMCNICQGPGCTDYGGPADYPCDGPFLECDVEAGAGVTIVGNFDGSNQRCPLATERRYITTADAATLDESFACIATLGAGPKTAVAAMSMMEALESSMLKGGCNDGFVRSDALLVVVIIQASRDELSPGTPAAWYDTLVTVKGGREEAVVVLVISEDSELPNGLCDGMAAGQNTLMALANTAAHGRFLSICAEDYSDFMQQGAGLALDQCAVLFPQ